MHNYICSFCHYVLLTLYARRHRDDLLEEGFTLKTTPSKVEIALAKKVQRKWNGLERPLGQGQCHELGFLQCL